MNKRQKNLLINTLIYAYALKFSKKKIKEIDQYIFSETDQEKLDRLATYDRLATIEKQYKNMTSKSNLDLNDFTKDSFKQAKINLDNLFSFNLELAGQDLMTWILTGEIEYLRFERFKTKYKDYLLELENYLESENY